MQQTILFHTRKLRSNLRRLLCAVLLFGVAALATQLVSGRLWQPLAAYDKAGQPSAPPTLEGAAAIEHLKQQNFYDSLGQALQATRYGVKWTEQVNLPGAQGAYAAANPAQQYHAYFTTPGLSLETAGGPAQSWRMTMELSGVGYGSRLALVSAGEVRAEGNRVEIRRTVGGSVATADQSAITEWYENRPRGLEQGFTLSRAPGKPRAGERLRLALKLAGVLRARMTARGQAVVFVDKDGREALRYDHLAAYDAMGRGLPARMAVTGDEVRIEIADEGAVYPMTIDPTITQQAYLKASNTEEADLFGRSVAISGDTVVIGAENESSSATGVNGDQSNNLALESGAAYVFVRNGTSWSRQAYLKASDTSSGDLFGASVAISGDAVVIGAADPGGLAGGSGRGRQAAYVFVRSGTSWSQQGYLVGFNTEAGDRFGASVAISGETVVVGAWFEDSSATGVDGDGSDNSAGQSGAAYVFTVSPFNTPPGTNVTVRSGDTTITFDSVSTAGNTTVTSIDPDSAGTLPGGFALTAPPLAFEIQTTATVTGPITICFYVPSVNDPGEFSNLRVLHNEGGTLVDRTILPPDSPAPDFSARTICARVASLSPFVIARLVSSPPVNKSFYLHGTGPSNNPPTLFLDETGPTLTTSKFKDSAAVSFNGGNPWKEIGTWSAGSMLTTGTLTALNDLHVWLGLKNSDDQGTRFDLRVEIYKNSTLVAFGETYCIEGVTRNANLAKEAIVMFATFSPVAFNGTNDGLSLKVLTRIGTNGAGGLCGGHSNATGLRLYFDSDNRPSRFNATF